MTCPTRRRFARSAVALAAASAGVLAAPARAAEDKKASPGDTLNVDMPGVIVPVAADGALRDYLFLTLEFRAGDFATAEFLRQRAFLVRDAIVRATSRAPAAAGPTRNSYDQPALLRTIAAAAASTGPRLRINAVRVAQAGFMRG